MTAARRHRSHRRRLALAGALALPALLAPVAAASAKAPVRPRIVFVRCSSVPYPCASHTTVTRGGRLLVGATGMSPRAKVVFTIRLRNRRAGLRVVGGTFRTRTRIVVRVPADAVGGPVRVANPGYRYSNAVHIDVRRPPKPKISGGVPPGGPSAFDGNGMWIWYVSRSQGGDPAAIAAQAKSHGIGTVYIKSADGTGAWAQFDATTVSALKAAGLHVCAWQFVYGTDPVGEAQAGAAAKAAGADCFVIDAEGAYEGKYAQAQRYMTELRQLLGASYPIGLTSFPYVDYHPALPFSVFLGPGGATFNLPQVYWKTIGDTVDASLAHTYEWNRPFATGIFPLGQTYDGPPATDVERFRQLSGAYGARGLSWWDWQEASASDWTALSAPVAPVAPPPTLWPTLAAGSGGKVGSKGDVVVWAQEHLNGAGYAVTVDGQYGAGSASAVSAFQAAAGLPVTGKVDAATWPALLRATPQMVDWVAQSRARASAARTASTARAATVGRNGPATATLRAKRDEIPPGPPRG
ncbi:MAG TPA: peptidoglycan-binding domain-containing protein [Conexibacter sp.]|nr:peptidoglycan-binding domain-containing protein [Conexibacter sp.]